jgi:putative SOS response-associated peptidase YedK
MLTSVVRHNDSWLGGSISWGYPVEWNQGKLILHARIESLNIKSFWENWRPCVLPVSSFIERNTINKQSKYTAFTSLQDLWLCGIWKKDSDDISRLVVVTMPSYSPAQEVHDRMPICLNTSDLEHWIHTKKPPNTVVKIMAEPKAQL